MPSDSIVDDFIKGLNTPEFVLVIGILIILAYVVIKALPMLENLRAKKIESEHVIELKKIENEQQHEERKAREFQQEMELNRQRTEVIGKQNEIIESLVRTADSQTVQMAGLTASLEESKIRSRSMGDTIHDTNVKASDTNKRITDIDSKVSEIHTMIVKANHVN